MGSAAARPLHLSHLLSFHALHFAEIVLHCPEVGVLLKIHAVLMLPEVSVQRNVVAVQILGQVHRVSVAGCHHVLVPPC